MLKFFGIVAMRCLTAFFAYVLIKYLCISMLNSFLGLALKLQYVPPSVHGCNAGLTLG
jgi:hypothetical protein